MLVGWALFRNPGLATKARYKCGLINRQGRACSSQSTYITITLRACLTYESLSCAGSDVSPTSPALPPTSTTARASWCDWCCRKSLICFDLFFLSEAVQGCSRKSYRQSYWRCVKLVNATAVITHQRAEGTYALPGAWYVSFQWTNRHSQGHKLQRNSSSFCRRNVVLLLITHVHKRIVRFYDECASTRTWFRYAGTQRLYYECSSKIIFYRWR